PCRRPLLDGEAVPDVGAPTGEAQVGPVLEDLRDVGAHLVALGTLARVVVLEDHPGRVGGADRVEILPVPGLVVARDHGSEVDGVILRLSTRSSPIRRVIPSASMRSSGSGAVLAPR